jgi:plasmid stability protein
MNTITLRNVSDELLESLKRRAEANHRSVEAEALVCLQITVAQEESILNAIPEKQWKQIEQSLCETIHDRGTPLTKADLDHYRDLVRGSKPR